MVTSKKRNYAYATLWKICFISDSVHSFSTASIYLFIPVVNDGNKSRLWGQLIPLSNELTTESQSCAKGDF